MADNAEPDPPPPPSEVTVTQPVTPTPAAAPPPHQGCMQKRSILEKILVVLVIIILIICLGFLAAFLVFYFFIAPPEGTCLTENCVKSAARLKSYMDESVDPCTNFYDYACGGWINSQVMGPHQNKLGVESIIGDSNRVKIREVLERPKTGKEAPYITQTKQFYATCNNIAGLNERGREPFLQLLKSVGKFPSLDDSWNETDFKLEDILIKLTKLLSMPLFTIDVNRDLKTSDVNRIYIADASLGLGSAGKYKTGRNDTRVRSYEKWLTENLALLGVFRPDAEQDAKDIVDLEIRIAKLMRSENDKGGIASRDNPVTVGELQSKCTWLNWLEYFQGIASDPASGGILFSLSEIVNNLEPIYLEKLGTVINTTSKRVLTNYMMSRLLTYTSTLGSDFLSLADHFNKETQGIDPKPRWERCASETTSLFPESVSRMYVDEFFSSSAQTYMTEMITDLMTSFSQMLEENDWMTPETKRTALSKLTLMVPKVGYPEYIKNDERLNNLYKSIPTNDKQYLESFIASTKLFVSDLMRRLREPMDKERWTVHAAVVNAHYHFLQNEIIFPAAFLQAPVFSQEYSSSMNYGGIGMVIMHEITHGFDNAGHLFDPKGILRDWWSEEDKDNFQSRAECFVDQYDCFKWDGHSIDGKRTLGENIADNGGLKQSYRAYRNFIKRKGSEEQRLPGLKLNHNQIFFLSFAQVWCSKFRDELKREVVETDVHTPSPFRVYGTLQNTQEFANAFRCPLGSRMNPVKKCILW